MRKTAVLFFILLFASNFAQAQTRIQAKDLFRQIDDGQTVNVKNAVIVGDLDLTKLKDMTRNKPYRRSERSNNTYYYHVRSSVAFINCTFDGDVIAYFSEPWPKNKTHITLFHDDVSFQGCTFKGKSAFKYSDFLGNAEFKNTTYHKEALFKYSEFSTDVSFAGSVFRSSANFKYTQFPEEAAFTGSKFRREGNFKYTKFRGGADFKQAVFSRLANFKYTKFSDFANFDDTSFDGNVDFKYTKYNGKSFTRHLLKNKKR